MVRSHWLLCHLMLLGFHGLTKAWAGCAWKVLSALTLKGPVAILIPALCRVERFLGAGEDLSPLFSSEAWGAAVHAPSKWQSKAALRAQWKITLQSFSSALALAVRPYKC